MNTANDITAQIKSVLPIEDIIGETVRLRPSGRGFSGLCPFHQEKTPSFHVYTDTQTYYCFGCRKNGDIVTWIMDTQGMTYPEALHYLADRAGVRIPDRRGYGTRGKPKDILGLAMSYFRQNISRSPAVQDYMRRRGLVREDIDRFSLGYSLNSWDGLLRHLREHGITDKETVSAGLALQSRTVYDRFRGRLMFGIKDITGKIIAFGGRLIDGEGAKYINSPESAGYRKRDNLYLLDTARKYMQEKKRSILVEGYMDALRLHKCGFGEAVASLGTSLTEKQAELLYRFADKCCICYDSDTAGQEAVMRSMYILAEKGLSVYVVNLPEGKDPDEYLSTHEPSDFEGLLGRAEPLIRHHVNMIAPAMKESAGRRKKLQEFFGALSRLDYLDVADEKAEICAKLGLRPMDIDRYLTEPQDIPEERKTYSADGDKITLLEEALCSLLYRNEELRKSLKPSEVMNAITGLRGLAFGIMTGDFPPDGMSAVTRGDELCRFPGTPREKWDKLSSSLKWHELTRRIEASTDAGEKYRLIMERSQYQK